jgi:hypothetical protein
MLNTKVFSLLLPRIFSLASFLLPAAAQAYDFFPGPGKDVRKSSLGVGAVAADSKSDVFTNPANLATNQKGHQLGATLGAFLPFNQLTAGALYQNSIFGLGLSYDQTKLSAIPDATYPQVSKEYSEKRFGLGAAMTLWKLKIGAKSYYNLQTMNYILGVVPDVQRNNQNISADLGAQFVLNEKINLGLLFGNLSLPGTDEKGMYFNGRNPFAALGATYEFSSRFKFNAGLKNEYDNEYGFKNLQLGLGAEARLLYFSILGQHAVLKGRLSFNPVVGQGISNTSAQDILSYAVAGMGLQFNRESDYVEKTKETVEVSYTSKKVIHLQVETREKAESIKKNIYTVKIDWEELSPKKYFEAEIVIRKLSPLLVARLKNYLKKDHRRKSEIDNPLWNGFNLPLGFVIEAFDGKNKVVYKEEDIERFKKTVTLSEEVIEKIREGGNIMMAHKYLSQETDLEETYVTDRHGKKYSLIAIHLTKKPVKALPQASELKFHDITLSEEEYKLFEKEIKAEQLQELKDYLSIKYKLKLNKKLNVKLSIQVSEQTSKTEKADQVIIKKHTVVMAQAEAEDLLKQFESKTFMGNIPGIDADELNIVSIQKIKEEEIDKKEVKTVHRESETIHQPSENVVGSFDVLIKSDRSNIFVGGQINYYFGRP